MKKGKTMKAAWFEKFGAATDVLEVGDLAAPVAGQGEVLVRVIASGVNPSDVKKRAGSLTADTHGASFPRSGHLSVI